MEDYSTEKWAEIIAESITNGQRKQAAGQFENALKEHCDTALLSMDIVGQGIGIDEVFKLLRMIIKRSK